VTRRVITREIAWRDVEEQASFLAQDSPRAAIRFMQAVRKCFHRLAAMPGIGFRCEFQSPLAEGLRRWPVPGFEHYLVFYRPLKEGVEIARVLHGARDIEKLLG